MAISSTQVWEVRSTANDLNGGGFDPGVTSPGTDWSKQDAPQVTFDGSTILATTSGASVAVITITGYTVQASDVGNTLNITGGTNFLTGWYTISSVNTGLNQWTLDRLVVSSGGAGAAMTGRMGGAFATITKVFSVTQTTSQGATGQVAWVKASATYTISSAIALNLTASLQVAGYTSARGDGGVVTLTTATNSTSLFSFSSATKDLIYFKNFIFSNTATIRAAGFAWGSSHQLGLGVFENCSFSGFTVAFDGFTNNPLILTLCFIGCKISSCTDCGIKFGNGTNGKQCLFLSGSLINGCTNQGILLNGTTGGTVTLENTVIYNNGSHGIWADVDGGVFDAPAILLNKSAIVSNGGDGVKFGTGGTPFSKTICIINTVFSANTGWQINFENAASNLCLGRNNAFNTTGSGTVNHGAVPPGQVTLSGDPFTSASTLDFSLNSTAGAGAACKQAGWPSSIPGS